VYAHFADLIERGDIEVDTGPLQTVADAFLRCRRERVEAFVE
jgi:D-galactose 1-dehydrogenase